MAVILAGMVAVHLYKICTIIIVLKHCCFYISATNAMIQMVRATDSVAEDVAAGSVEVCAEISGTIELECVVQTNATTNGSAKAGK